MENAPITDFIVPRTVRPSVYYVPGSGGLRNLTSTKGATVIRCLRAILVVLLILVIFCMVYFGCSGRALSAKLCKSGWILFVRPGCSFCDKQLRALGGNPFPRQITCGASAGASKACSKIPAFPFWINSRTGDTRVGFQNQIRLLEML